MSDLFLATPRNGAKFAVVFLPVMPTWKMRLNKARINHRPQQDFGKWGSCIFRPEYDNSKILLIDIKKNRQSP